MNNNSAEWQREFYLTHDKYRMQRQGTDCYKVVKGLTRILQLPTIAKLTTDNESVIGDFRLNRGEYGLDPYDEYAIKVDDTYGASLYILVHKRADKTFLCPILVGFEGENACAMVKPTDNWRMRENGYFVIKDCCSVSVVLSNFQLTEDEFCFLLWADFLIRMCFVLYGIFHVNLFTQKSNQWRACEYDISCLARVVLFCVAHRRDSRNWQPYR